MITLDPYVTALLIGANAVALATAVLFSARQYPQPISTAFLMFGGGKLVVGGGFVLVAFRQVLPPDLSVVGANVLIVGGMCINLMAVRALQGKAQPYRLVAAVMATLLLGTGYFVYVDPNLRGVQGVNGGLGLIVCGRLVLEVLVWYRGPGRSHLLGGAMAVLIMIMLGLRTANALTGAPHALDSLDRAWEEQIFFVLTYVVATVASLNFIMMGNDLFNDELRRLAASDPLTGLDNRRRLEERGAGEVRRAHRFQRPLAVLVIDLDHFKRVNDGWGHAVGDLVLKATAECCREQLRDVDVVARLGGEEFVALLPETSMRTARDIAERLRLAIADISMEVRPPLSVTASLGVALLADGETFDAVVARADQALYAAKNGGRNRVCLATAIAGGAGCPDTDSETGRAAETRSLPAA